MAHGADITLTSNRGTFGQGPPVLEAANEATLKLLGSYQAEGLVPDGLDYGRLWLDRLVVQTGDTSASAEPILWRLRWLEERGLRYGYSDDPDLLYQDPLLRARWKHDYYAAGDYGPALATGWRQVVEALQRMRRLDPATSLAGQGKTASTATEQAPATASSDTGPIRAETVDRGGTLARLRNRKALRKLSGKIHERSISYDELKEYLRLGGSPTVLSNYVQVTPQWLQYDADQALLNYFIVDQDSLYRYFDLPLYFVDRPLSQQLEQRSDRQRLRCLQLLLQNGADSQHSVGSDIGPNHWEREMGGPALLNASEYGDAQAVALMLAAGANVNFSWQPDSGPGMGPPLADALDDATADAIWQHHPDTGYRNSEGLNLLQMAVASGRPARWVLQRLRWMERKGLRFGWREGDSNDPERWVLAGIKSKRQGSQLVEMIEQEARDWQQIAELLPRLKK
ncbi:MAG: hypothetical protein ACK5HY_12995 [Parahaliea sp.]